MMRYILTTLLFCSFLFNGTAQKIGHEDYQYHSKWFIGADIGMTWHSSDVKNIKNKFPIAAGINFGRSFNQDYGNLLAYDLRFRLLGGSWYGQDRDTTGVSHSATLSKYYDDLGYSVQNFRARQTDLSVEFAVHLNRIKERTGFDPYVFGSLGFTFTRTLGDLIANETGDDYLTTVIDGYSYPIYDYSQNTSGSFIQNKYTIPLDKNENGDSYGRFRSVNFMPSLGIGIGYYFTPRFSIGLEHRSTFFPNDYFDGTAISQTGEPSKGLKNDVYHYTHLYLKWYLRGRKHLPEKPVVVDPQHPNIPDITEQESPRPPVVKFTNPSSSPIKVNHSSYSLQANVKNVSGSNNLTFTQNGGSRTNFTFNNEFFNSNVTLVRGENVFQLVGVNKYGSDSDVVTIIYEDERTPQENPPYVKITSPSYSPYTVNQNYYSVKADIRNIQARNQLTVTFNGYNLTDYSFSPNGSINFTANLNLREGNNELSIVGSNSAGSASDHTIIIYKEGRTPLGQPPVVKVTRPQQRPYITSNMSEIVEATVNNVTSKNQIEVRVNNVQTNNFTYNSNTNQVSLNANLNAGNNQVVISASNDYGSDSDYAQFEYQRTPKNPPVVNIIVPHNRPHTTENSSENIVASVQNITSKNQITVRINGSNTTNFNFNSSTNLVEFTAPLNTGANNIQVTVSNNDGSDIDAIQINYNRQVKNPPVVNIVSPSARPYNTSTPEVNIVANVQNVTQKSQVTVRINGSTTSNFTYNNVAKTVVFNAPLNSGSNNIQVTATNNDGTDNDAIQVIYTRAPKNPPVVNIVSPSVRPYNTSTANVNIVANVQNVTQKSQVTVRINGSTTSNFTFNNVAKTVVFNAPLISGNNDIQVTATNNDGTDSDAIQVIYTRAPKNPPVVNIVSPSVRPYNTSTANVNIVANVQNVTQKSQVTVRINGSTTSNFTYNNVAKTVVFNAPLISGNNNIQVTATNNDGTDSDAIQVIFKREIKTPPTVKIVSPNVNPFTTNQSTVNVIANVQNISAKNQIAVRINGSTTSNFTFNNAAKTVTFNAPLTNGNNSIQITVTNNDGTNSDETNVFYRVAAPIKPEVSFENPPKPGLSVIQSEFDIVANVKFAERKDITLTVNGKKVTNFTYNSSTMELTYKSPLALGKNDFKITAKNNAGSAEDLTTINRFSYVVRPKDPIIIDEPEPTCGVVMDVAVGEYDICLNTPSGYFTKGVLNNVNFYYKGTAKDVYFRAEKNGYAMVNNELYNLEKGNYYQFFGNLEIEIKRVGSQWVICVESSRPPFTSTPENKTPSNCQPAQQQQQSPGVKEQKKPSRQTVPSTGTPQTSKRPGQINSEESPGNGEQPTRRQEPTRNTDRR